MLRILRWFMKRVEERRAAKAAARAALERSMRREAPRFEERGPTAREERMAERRRHRVPW